MTTRGSSAHIRVHLHEWNDWTVPVVIRDYAGNAIDTNTWATFRGGRPITRGWSRTCRECGQQETT